MPTALPYITIDDENAILTLSPSGASSGSTVGPSLGTGTLSPVSDASCMLMLLSFIILMSAGTIAPSSRYTISPGTSSLAGTTLSSPFLRTRALGAVIFLRASNASAAFFSWITPTEALRTITHKITMASGKPSPPPISSGKKYITSENIMARNKIITMMSDICSQIILHTLLGFTSLSTFLPYFCNRAAASSSERPSSLVFRTSSVCR